MQWARIENSKVMEVTEINPDGRYHPSLIWVECPADVQQGYIQDNGKFKPAETAEQAI